MDDKCFEKTYVAGCGMVGMAVARRMKAAGLPAPLMRTRAELDLTNQVAVNEFFRREKPTAVVVAAAKVGGIEANRTKPAEFIYQNLSIATNIVNAAYRNGTKRLLYLGSSCIYPRLAPQPIPETALMEGALEPTNEGYAISKIAGMKLCQMFRRQYGVCFHSAMPTNLYGPGDNYDPVSSHVLPAMIRRFEQARLEKRTVERLWGTGSALREFLHVDDLADALLFLLRLNDPPDWVNIGSGREVSIRRLAEMVRDACGADCALEWDSSHPDGTPRKLLDTSLINGFGWSPRISLEEGIRRTVEEYRREVANGTLRVVRQ